MPPPFAGNPPVKSHGEAESEPVRGFSPPLPYSTAEMLPLLVDEVMALVVNLTTIASFAPKPPLLVVRACCVVPQGMVMTCGVNPRNVQADVSVVPPPPPPPPPAATVTVTDFELLGPVALLAIAVKVVCARTLIEAAHAVPVTPPAVHVQVVTGS